MICGFPPQSKVLATRMILSEPFIEYETNTKHIASRLDTGRSLILKWTFSCYNFGFGHRFGIFCCIQSQSDWANMESRGDDVVNQERPQSKVHQFFLE